MRAREKVVRSSGKKKESETSSDSSSSQNSPTPSTVTVSPGCMAAEPRVQELMRQFAEHAYKSYMQGTPALSHLSLLVRYNVSSALRRNADILGVSSEYVKWDGLSPFPQNRDSLAALSSDKSAEWPKNLHPTQMQRSIEHHPWVDVFPWPRLRDNMVQAFEHPDICDEDDMCRDVCEYDEHGSEPILVVWGDAWDPRSWEITPGFLKKWGWLLSGCDDFLEATNNWRARREEKPITRRQLFDAIQSSMPERLQTPGS
ncbi:hypothetical protein FB567DRAFT_329477 [Paraphoma chrysanthemicola]|uniref:Uncharacterized protein n=1 Tax=Paraphoma chrysanthemicola TaxID=798071 RepID=A0A8K0R6Q4_9PLEO|nr:hypothetical protein FB567DRAFT_329477 [Paraphoma chrysanthemicola]